MIPSHRVLALVDQCCFGSCFIFNLTDDQCSLAFRILSSLFEDIHCIFMAGASFPDLGGPFWILETGTATQARGWFWIFGQSPGK